MAIAAQVEGTMCCKVHFFSFAVLLLCASAFFSVLLLCVCYVRDVSVLCVLVVLLVTICIIGEAR